jgi:uncharacterized surface protein with fasciclin (FAS1) repeats
MSKLIAVVAAAALLVTASATAAPAERPAAASPSIVETAIAVNATAPYTGMFDTLICLVANNPAVLDLLSQKGQYTVFAPTDDAFAAIGVTGANCAAAAPTVTNILAYHVANGRRDAADVISSTQLRMRNGDFAAVTSAGGAYYVDGAEILVTDVFASNGVIHVVDKVLLP